MNPHAEGAESERGLFVSTLSESLRDDLSLFLLMGVMGVASAHLNVRIPHTDVFIEARYAFGFMGFALIRRLWVSMLLACLLAVGGPHQLPLLLVFPGNLLYGVPCLAAIRAVHWHVLSKRRSLWLFGVGWLLLVLFCYQAFNTPVLWALLAMMRDAPVWPAVIDGWREQPFLIESFIVAIISASGMVALRSHENLRRSQHELAITLDSIGDGVIAADAQGRVTRMNPVAQSLTGWSLEAARGKPLEDVFCIFNAQTRESVENPVERVLQEGRIMGLANHTCLIARDGTEYQIADSAAPLKEADGRVIGAVMVFRDVTREYEDRAALEHGKRQLDLALRAAVMGVWDWEIATGRVAWAGEHAALFGIPIEDFGGTIDDVQRCVHPDDREQAMTVFRRVVEEGAEFDNTYRVVWPDGGIRWMHSYGNLIRNENGEPWRIMGTTRDITAYRRMNEERDRLETQFHQSQKLESVGRLAGGVAHDLNNLLTPILGYGEMLLEDFGEDDARRTSVEEIVGSGLRARDLVRQLLAFSRKQLLEFKPVDLNEVLSRFEKLLRRTIREDVALKIAPAPSLPLVRADIGQIEQVIMNLAVNAQDAMPDGGELTIETVATELDSVYAADRPGVTPGPYIMLSVSDTGSGMDAETRERIFEPFFTTKEKGKGTGLGLATVYGIVKQHGGNIWVYSEPGKGATFKVYLPVFDGADAPAAESIVAEQGDLGGAETILLVEDNEQVRDLTETLLKRHGYQVLVAENGEEALSAVDRHDGRIDLLLTDVVMPGMSGKDLFDRVAARFPHTKILYMSGYTDNVIAHRGVMDEGVNFIQKPFAVKALASKVRDVLERN